MNIFHVPLHVVSVGKWFVADVTLDRPRVRDHVPQKRLPGGEHLAAEVARGFAQVHLIVVATRAPLLKFF